MALRAELAAMRRLWREVEVSPPAWDLLGIRRSLRRAFAFARREHASPGKLAAAVLVGVLVGTSPFFGLHLLLCVLLGLLLRLNKCVLYAAANVSLPVFAPFLIVASVQAGSLLLEGRLREGAPGAEDFLYWLCGWPLVGLGLGLPAAGLAWGLARLRRQPPE